MLEFIGVSTWSEEDADRYVHNPFMNEVPLTGKQTSPSKRVQNECNDN